jgi:hypothetical protein
LESGSFLCFEEVRTAGLFVFLGIESRLDRGLTIFTKAATTAGTVLAVAALAGCGGGGSDKKSSGIPDKIRANYIAGCEQTQQNRAGCECLVDSLQKHGIDTEAKLQTLSEKVQTATQDKNPAAFPAEFKQAITDCRSKLVKTPTP